jgi:hypothetical protein
VSDRGIEARLWIEQARKNGALPIVVEAAGRRYLTWEIGDASAAPPVELRQAICDLLTPT